MLYRIFAAAIIIIVGIITRPKVKFGLHIANGQSNAYIDTYVFYKLIKIPIHLRFLHTHGEKLCIRVMRSNGTSKVIFPMPQKEEKLLLNVLKRVFLSHYSDAVDMHCVSQRVRIGTGEPISSVCLCCVVDNAFRLVTSGLFFDNAPQITTESYPDFSRKVFILNMEGIMHINHVKIILKVIATLVKYKNRKETST